MEYESDRSLPEDDEKPPEEPPLEEGDALTVATTALDSTVDFNGKSPTPEEEIAK